MFENSRDAISNYSSKLVLINGDIALDGLGLSQSDREMLTNNVEIVFHCAAIVRFDKNIKETGNINVCGTLRMLKLAEEMKRLRSFTYMSTAFCQSYQMELKEEHYPTNLNAMEVVRSIQTWDNDALDKLTSEL